MHKTYRKSIRKFFIQTEFGKDRVTGKRVRKKSFGVRQVSIGGEALSTYRSLYLSR